MDRQKDAHAPRQRLLCCIVPTEHEPRLKNTLRTLHLPLLHRCTGQGTAPSELLDIFGLGGTSRTLIVTLLPRTDTAAVFSALAQHAAIREHGSGIGFTVPISAMQDRVLAALKKPNDDTDRGGDDMPDNDDRSYAAIWVSVARGFSEEVVKTATAAGATGGTVLRGSRICTEAAADALDLDRQDEQEFVLILTEKEKKNAIMSALCAACGLTTPAHGIILSVPVDQVCGLPGCSRT